MRCFALVRDVSISTELGHQRFFSCLQNLLRPELPLRYNDTYESPCLLCNFLRFQVLSTPWLLLQSFTSLLDTAFNGPLPAVAAMIPLVNFHDHLGELFDGVSRSYLLFLWFSIFDTQFASRGYVRLFPTTVSKGGLVHESGISRFHFLLSTMHTCIFSDLILALLDVLLVDGWIAVLCSS